MTTIKLKESVSKPITRVEVIKPALICKKCDCCGRNFQMKEYCNDSLRPGTINGTFEATYGTKGNMFFADVCSATCAAKIVDGGWKEMSKYSGYAKREIELVRVGIGLTTLVKFEDELIEGWEEE